MTECRECRILVLLGAPGAGKGTQTIKLVREFRMKHLSTGEALRQKAGEDTLLGNQTAKAWNEENWFQTNWWLRWSVSA